MPRATGFQFDESLKTGLAKHLKKRINGDDPERLPTRLRLKIGRSNHPDVDTVDKRAVPEINGQIQFQRLYYHIVRFIRVPDQTFLYRIDSPERRVWKYASFRSRNSKFSDDPIKRVPSGASI